MSETKIINAQGKPFELAEEKVASVYNLDQGFWLSRIASASELFSSVTTKPYQFHSTVFACCRAISYNIGGLPKAIYNCKTEEKVLDLEHELVQLIRKPNEFFSGSDLIELTVLYLMLPTRTTPGGQCFWIGDNGKGGWTNWARGEIPVQVFCYSDATIKAKRNKLTGWIDGWKMNVAGLDVIDFTNEEVLRFRMMNPYDMAQGMSPYSAAQFAVMQDAKADEFNTKTYDNEGRLTGYLKTEQPVNKNQAAEILNAWHENYAGAGNRDKVALLPFGLTYEQFALSQMDMQFIQQKRVNRQQVQNVYGVPDSEIAIYESGMNRATAQQADRNFWQKTLLPIDRKICTSLNDTWLINIKPKTNRIVSDLTAIESLRDDLDLKSQIAFRYWQMGTPAAEAFRQVDLPIDTKKYPWMETYFVNGGVVDARFISENTTEVTPNKVKEKEDETELEEKETNKIYFKKMDREKLSIDYIMKVLDPQEKLLRKDLADDYFIRQRNEMLDKVDKWKKENKSFEFINFDELQTPEKLMSQIGNLYIDISRDKHIILGSEGAIVFTKIKGIYKAAKIPVKNFLLDINKETEKLIKLYKPYVKDQMKVEKERVEQELGVSVDWGVTADKILEFTDSRKEALKSINETTFHKVSEQVSDAVTNGLEENLTNAEIADSIKKVITGVVESRRANATTIARTEINTISSEAREEMFNESGITQWEWLTAHDERVRETHQEEDGNVVEVGEAFPATALTRPCDPNGDLSEIINCRCTTVPIKE